MNTLRVPDRRVTSSFAIPLLAISLFLPASAPSTFAQSTAGQTRPSINTSRALQKNAPAEDWITGLPREPIHVAAWPGGKKVAVCFVLYIEVWGYGHGPNFRSDMDGRDPDVVDESFRQYADLQSVVKAAGEQR